MKSVIFRNVLQIEESRLIGEREKCVSFLVAIFKTSNSLLCSYVPIVINLISKRCILHTFYMYLCYVELLNGVYTRL